MTFQQLKSSCLDVLAQSQNCAESQARFGAASNVSELAQAMRQYINGVLHEVPQQVIAFLAKHYATYRDEIRAADVYYNEHSATGSGIVIVGDMPDSFSSPLVIDSNTPQPVHVYVLGAASVVVGGHAHLYCNNPDARVELHDHASATVLSGYAVARDRSRLTTHDRCECHNFSSVIVISKQQVRDFGHARLNTFTPASAVTPSHPNTPTS